MEKKCVLNKVFIKNYLVNRIFVEHLLSLCINIHYKK